ncbi:glycosyl hydrolase family 18 protein [Dongshaea marina]|uniref:glycosyl hydrolase family 18 protein n=1 Tax=Dongshaea marina TaxID=2047966 RepID=UPI000D3E1C90|nr:glycosyl hydrolase family 18 protein [Dongshaea marina]
MSVLRKLKYSLLVAVMGAPLTANAFYNMSYVEVNSNALSNVGCYLLEKTGQPFFDMTSIFAANINGSDPNQPEIYFNPQVKHVLDNTSEVQELHGKGIKVLLTILGNHQNAGWSCMTDPAAAKKFADQLADVVQKYDLDGIDIDDEYSSCAGNDTSMIMIAQALKENPKFKGKILSKALFRDGLNFNGHYQGHSLADYLDQGWEMSYGTGGPDGRLPKYLGYGMSKADLALGVSTNNSAQSAAQWIGDTMQEGYGGAMVYNVTNNSQSFLSSIAEAEYQQSVAVSPNCLK